MRVVLVGGYGVFGAYLAELLARDGHTLWVAGRSLEKAQTKAHELGVNAMQVDVFDAPEKLFTPRPDVVIDAVGPFQAYGDARYRLAQLCIQKGAHYLDLSDGSDFTAGISALNEAAKRAGVVVLSGASSVPGLSSTVVDALGADMQCITSIESAILPANNAPRGKSVIASIVSQVGAPLKVWRGGQWVQERGWGSRELYELKPDLRRAGYPIGVPDLTLFPAFFGASSVRFHAGLELPIMNAALAALSRLRSLVPLPMPSWALMALRTVADWMRPLGTDFGGMVVRVRGFKDGVPITREWRLWAAEGDGPYVPSLIVRALLRNLARVPKGARPCLAEVPLGAVLESFEDASGKLAITTQTQTLPTPYLFKTALGDAWNILQPQAQRLHQNDDVGRYEGVASVERGSGWIARLVAAVFRFPKASQAVPLTVSKTRSGDGELWVRHFGQDTFASTLLPSPQPNHVRERFGLFTFEQSLPVADGVMQMQVERGWFGGIPLPGWALPVSRAREYVEDGVFRFDVALETPLSWMPGSGFIVRYRGTLSPTEASDPNSAAYRADGVYEPKVLL